MSTALNFRLARLGLSRPLVDLEKKKGLAGDV